MSLLERLFVVLLFLILLIGGSLTVLAFNENNSNSSTTANANNEPESIKTYIIRDGDYNLDNTVESYKNDKYNLDNNAISEDYYQYLVHQIKQLRHKVRTIPVVITPGY